MPFTINFILHYFKLSRFLKQNYCKTIGTLGSDVMFINFSMYFAFAACLIVYVKQFLYERCHIKKSFLFTDLLTYLLTYLIGKI